MERYPFGCLSFLTSFKHVLVKPCKNIDITKIMPKRIANGVKRIAILESMHLAQFYL